MKVYNRTENGVTTTVSQREGLDEINAAMTTGSRKVATMSSINRTDYQITYKYGPTVKLVLVDAPAPVADEIEKTEEPMDWASTRTGNVEHRFDADGRALCSKRLRAYDRPVSQTDRRVRRTRSEVEAGPHAHLYNFCPNCSAL